MITISPDAADRLADPRCRICKGRGYIDRTEEDLLIACDCAKQVAMRSRRRKTKAPVQPETNRHD